MRSCDLWVDLRVCAVRREIENLRAPFLDDVDDLGKDGGRKLQDLGFPGVFAVDVQRIHQHAGVRAALLQALDHHVVGRGLDRVIDRLADRAGAPERLVGADEDRSPALDGAARSLDEVSAEIVKERQVIPAAPARKHALAAAAVLGFDRLLTARSGNRRLLRLDQVHQFHSGSLFSGGLSFRCERAECCVGLRASLTIVTRRLASRPK